MRTMHLRTFALLCFAAVAATAPPVAAQEPTTQTTVIWVVRHAEKADDGTNDPPLSEAGEQRVGSLVRMFADAGLTAVHTTAYRRTRDTAGPVAAALGLVPREYNPRALDAFARELAAAGRRHLVIGHSNTNPDLVRALGGVAEAIPDTEYGRIYEVTVGPDGVRTVVRGYAP